VLYFIPDSAWPRSGCLCRVWPTCWAAFILPKVYIAFKALSGMRGL
jgi:hypothetical protein